MDKDYNKANLSLNPELYNWLEGIRQRTKARSVPDIVRKLLVMVRQATTDTTTALMMIETIEHITTPDPDANEIDLLFAEHQEQQQLEYIQRWNAMERL